MMADRIGYQTQQFSLNNPKGEGQEDVPTLLRRLAATLEEMGDIEIRDLVFHPDTDDEGDSWPFMTVYFTYEPEDPAGNGNGLR